MRSVYDTKKVKSYKECTMFLDEDNGSVAIARYDDPRHPRLDKMTEVQWGFFWQPSEVDISKDRKDFEDLNDHEKHIFTSNLKRQILLDSVQGRSPGLAFGPLASLPELEIFIGAWQFFETIHSKSYTHIIRNIYPNPSKVFDEINDIPEIMDCAADISKYYDELIHFTNYVDLNGYDDKYTRYGHKKKLWLALNAVNILEGIRFYVSFACSWAFAEQKRMEGNAKIIKFICRDENVHLGATQFMINEMPKEDPDFAKIRQETHEEVIDMFVQAVDQEKAWAEYLFKDGSMIGLTCDLLSQYVEWIASKRMQRIGLPCPYTVSQSNPLPWTVNWIAGKERQVAPQETEISSYISGGVDKSQKKEDIILDLKL
jgi:ribonucleoside-diphosphate reductase beta chain